MNKLVLIGGGGHCKSVIDVARRMDCFDDIVITDPNIAKGTQVLGCTVIGTDDYLEELYQKGYRYAFVTIGSIGVNILREKLAKRAFSIGYRFPIIQDPSSTIADSAIIEEGTFIGKNVTVNADAKIGQHCIINTGAIIEHECCVGDYSHVSVGATLCGDVKIGKHSMIGAKSVIIQGLDVGEKCIVGAGSVVTKKLPGNCIAMGVPAKIRY